MLNFIYIVKKINTRVGKMKIRGRYYLYNPQNYCVTAWHITFTRRYTTCICPHSLYLLLVTWSKEHKCPSLLLSIFIFPSFNSRHNDRKSFFNQFRSSKSGTIHSRINSLHMIYYINVFNLTFSRLRGRLSRIPKMYSPESQVLSIYSMKFHRIVGYADSTNV